MSLCLCFFLADKCKVRVPFGLLKTTASTASLLFLNPVDSQFIFFVYKSYRLIIFSIISKFFPPTCGQGQSPLFL